MFLFLGGPLEFQLGSRLHPLTFYSRKAGRVHPRIIGLATIALQGTLRYIITYLWEYLFSLLLQTLNETSPCYIHSCVRVRFKCKDTDPIVMNSFWFNSRCYYYKGGLWWWWCWSEGIFSIFVFRRPQKSKNILHLCSVLDFLYL